MQILHKNINGNKIGCNITGTPKICFHCGEPDCLFENIQPDQILFVAEKESLEFGERMKAERDG